MSDTILVVDDEVDVEPLMRQVFRKRVRNGEIDLLFGHNGVEALNILRDRSDVRILLTDINMPQMDGLSLLNHLSEVRPVPAVVVSAYGDMDNIRTAMNRGAFDFLTKPLNLADLDITVQKTLEHAHRLQEARLAEAYRIAKEAAEQANHLKSQFLAFASHELRTPLNGILMMAELMLEESGESSPSQYGQDVRTILESSRRLLRFVNDILDMSKIEANRMDLVLEDFDTESFVAEVLASLRPLLDKKPVVLEAAVVAASGAIHADRHRLGQCLTNIVANAIKFTAQGSIKVETRRFKDGEREWVAMSVADTGVGMTPEQVASMFEPFAQAHSKVSRDFGGTGLGLSITQRLVHLMGGRVTATSLLGKGSRFELCLPAGFGGPGDDSGVREITESRGFECPTPQRLPS